MHAAAFSPLHDTSARIPSKAMSLIACVIDKMHCHLVPEQAASSYFSTGLKTRQRKCRAAVLCAVHSRKGVPF